MKILRVTAVIAVLAIGLVAWFAIRNDDIGATHKLPDGSTLQLLHVAFTATNYTYSHQNGNRWIRKILPILPPSMRSRFTASSGSLGWSGSEGTNLIAITINRSDVQGWTFSSGRLRFFDDQGNTYDAVWGASMLGDAGQAVHGWRAPAFPRRSRMLGLQFLIQSPTAITTNLAEFHIRNPLYAKYPQWKPEPWPTAKQDGSLAVTLKQFNAWPNDTNLPAGGRTRLEFSFAENGTESKDWRVQKLTISDATGNLWSPYLDFIQPRRRDWTANGTLELLGALWPGEQAWKLRVEVVRTAGFDAEQLWDVRVPLPPPNIAMPLTSRWEHDGTVISLVSIASPETDHNTGDYKWIAKWWGEDKKKVYSLALGVHPTLEGKRVNLIRAFDENDREIKMVQHGSQDSDKQALFFKPTDGATEARFTFALQRSRFVEFLARPEFKRTESAEAPKLTP